MGTQPGRRRGRTGSLQAARAFVEDNLEWGDLTPLNTARAIGVSVRQLHLLFEPTGVSFSRYVLAQRLERARTELADPERTVLEVALSCGIESSAVFYRAFRQAYGVTPTEYRRSLPQPCALRRGASRDAADQSQRSVFS